MSIKKIVYSFYFILQVSAISSFAQDSVFVYPSLKEFNEIFSSKVKPIENFFHYNYLLSNDSVSKQSICCFFVDLYSSVITIYNTDGWSSAITLDYPPTINWCSGDSLYFIFPGVRNKKFSFSAFGLPTICNYYAVGYAEIPEFSEDNEPWEVEGNDLLKNCKIGKTIGAKDPPTTFIPEQFIDTLISYTERSHTLNWINTQDISSKYQDYLIKSKTALQQNKHILARCYLQDILREVDIDSSSTITSEAYALLRYNTEYLISKLPPVTGLIVRLTDSKGDILSGGTLQYYEGSWKNAVDNQDGTFLVSTNLSKVSLRMTYAYGSQTLSNVRVGNDVVTFKTVNAVVQLKDSGGNLIDQGSVQYYSGAWREFGVTTNGIATKELLPNNYSFRITYAFASNDIQQDISTNNIVVFQTVNASVQLKNSLGEYVDQGNVQYYSGAWRDFGVITNGVATKELLPNNYSFRMIYAYGSNDKQQNIGTNPIVVFNTVRARVELRNSQGNLIDGGTVQYYSGGWREFGTTENGIAAKELLPNNYSFRMSYAFVSNDKQQNIGDNATVVFQTINTVVELSNSQGNLIDGGVVQYYSGGWRNFGTTTNGTVSRELLPNNYSFRMTHEYISSDKTQNIGTNRTVVFSTVLCTIQVRNAQNQPLNNALASYYSGGWRTIGNTVNGEITKELLPANLTFRVNYNGVQKDITQNLSTNNIVQFVF